MINFLAEKPGIFLIADGDGLMDNKKGGILQYNHIAKAALEAQYIDDVDKAEDYVSALMSAAKFIRTNDLKVTKDFKKTKTRKFVKLINPLEVREAIVNKDTNRAEITFLVEDYEET